MNFSLKPLGSHISKNPVLKLVCWDGESNLGGAQRQDSVFATRKVLGSILNPGAKNSVDSVYPEASSFGKPDLLCHPLQPPGGVFPPSLPSARIPSGQLS